MSTVFSPSQSRVVTLCLRIRKSAPLGGSCALVLLSVALKLRSLFIQSLSDLSLVGYSAVYVMI